MAKHTIVLPDAKPQTIEQCYQNLADAVVLESWNEYQKVRRLYDETAWAMTRKKAEKTFFRLKRLERFFNSGWCFELCQVDTPIFLRMIRNIYGYAILDVDNTRPTAHIKKRKKPRTIQRKELHRR